MKRILIAVALLLLFNVFFTTTKIFAEEINNGLMTLELPQSIQVDGVSQDPVVMKLNVPDTWSMSINNTNDRNDFIFKHLTNPDKIEISLINLATYFKNEESKSMIINSSINGAEKSIKTSTQKLNTPFDKNIGLDNILNNEITYCLFSLKVNNEMAYYKFLYPSSDKNLFIIYVYFKDDAPFNDAEQLINNLILAITNSN